MYGVARHALSMRTPVFYRPCANLPRVRIIPIKPVLRPADAEKRMVHRSHGVVHNPPAVSNAKRQREFRDRNPGYFKKYYARRKAIGLAAIARREAELKAAEAESTVAASRERLMIPAPAEPLIFPGLNETCETSAPLPIILPTRSSRLRSDVPATPAFRIRDNVRASLGDRSRS
jgi:hypothetical protein